MKGVCRKTSLLYSTTSITGSPPTIVCKSASSPGYYTLPCVSHGALEHELGFHSHPRPSGSLAELDLPSLDAGRQSGRAAALNAELSGDLGR